MKSILEVDCEVLGVVEVEDMVVDLGRYGD